MNYRYKSSRINFLGLFVVFNSVVSSSSLGAEKCYSYISKYPLWEEIMSNYSTFATFYDTAMGDMSLKIGFLESLIQQYAPTAKSVLEFASGTGTILEGLAKRYEVAGFDLSADMTAIARKKLPGVEIKVGDMTNFDFGKQFDVVLCVYDSINHLLEWPMWQATFENAHRHLHEGGIFIFDFNTTKRLDWLASNPPFGSTLGDDHMIMNVKSENNVFDWDIKVFHKDDDGRFTLHQDHAYEVSFPEEQIEAEISKLFTVEAIANNKNLKPDEVNWRPFFVCRKR